MKVYTTNGKTEQDNHHLEIGKMKIVMTTYELLRLIVAIVIVVSFYFTFKGDMREIRDMMNTIQQENVYQNKRLNSIDTSLGKINTRHIVEDAIKSKQ